MSTLFGPDYVRAIAPYQGGKPIAEVAREFGLDEAAIIRFAAAGAAEHAICAVAVLSELSLPAAEQAVLGPDRDAVLLVARGLGWSWDTVAALISLRKDFGKSDAAVQRARQHFRTIPKETAQRVLGFLRMRDAQP